LANLLLRRARQDRRARESAGPADPRRWRTGRTGTEALAEPKGRAAAAQQRGAQILLTNDAGNALFLRRYIILYVNRPLLVFTETR
jgi:hypothetical protein